MKWKNIDRNGKPIHKGTRAIFRMPGLPDEQITLDYNNRLGWHYYSERHGQPFIMPTNHEAGKVNRFHRCEVIA